MKSDSYKLIPQTVKESFFVVILTALYLLLTLTGCNNIVENPGTGNQTPPEDGSGLVAVTGQISLSGAFPGTLQSSTGSQRTAIPTVGVVTYTVTAQNKADPGERVTATVTDYNYTLYLSPGTWTISCSGVNESGSQIIREKSPIELTVTQGVATPQPGILELVLSQTPGTGGTGAVSLNGAIDFVKDGSAAAVTLDITLTPWDSFVRAPDIPQQTITGNGNFTVTLDTVPSGAYIMRLVFSVDGVAVSTVEEAVNVFDNMTTDTWYVGGGNSDHLISQQDGSAVFNLTRCQTEFFINGTGGDDTNSGSALKPLKTVGKAFSVLGKVKGADAKITLQSDAGDTAGVTVPEGVNAVIFGEQAATVPELISVGNGATVKVGTNVTCTGGVMVQNGGSLTLTQGGRIDGTGLSGIKNSSGGAVYIDGGTFTMENGSTVTGGNITGNGGGVYVDSGTFTMNGGKISDGNAMLGGNGVFVNIGDFVMNGGEITECGKGSQPGNGAVMIYKSASDDGAGRFVMKSGKIYGNSAEQGAGVFVNGGTFEMSGGSISDNEAIGPTGSGGAVYVYNGSFDMSGNATINNNQSSMDAGGVFVDGTGIFTVTGSGTLVPSISGNSAQGDGGGVYVDGTFSVSGTPTITGNTVSNNANNVYLPGGKTITIGDGGLTGGTIGVTAEDMKAGAAAQITDIDVPGAANKFTSDISPYSVEENIATTDGGTAVFLSDAEVAYKSSSAQGKTLGSFAKACSSQSQWSSGGVITLLKDISLTQTAAITGGNQSGFNSDTGEGGSPVTIDLNGHTISGNGSASVLSVSTGFLEIEDSSANPDGTGGTVGTGMITGGGGSSGGGIDVDTSGVLRLVSGAITGNEADTGAGVYVSGKFVMNGGSIRTNTAENNSGISIGNSIGSYGGGVCVDSNGTFTMNSGTISGNKVVGTRNDFGGGVYVYVGEFSMNGGTIGGTGNDVNTALKGGGVFVNGGTFIMSGDAAIKGNSATESGGGVFVNGGEFSMNGGTIGGTGNVTNTAGYGGGVGMSGGTFNMSGDASISGNRATGVGYGGGVYLGTGTFNMSGDAAIKGNSAVSGGGVYVDNGDGTFDPQGGTVSDNKPDNVYRKPKP